MKKYLILIFILLSCSPHYDYHTLSELNRGLQKDYVLDKFNIDNEDIIDLNFEGDNYQIYHKRYFVISGNRMPGGTYDIFVFVFKNNVLEEFGVLEDFRRSAFMFNRDVAKIVSEKL